MAETMIERVARAIDPGVWENWDNWVALKGYDDAERAEEFARSTSLHQSLARAESAVEAMWTPTKGMLTACWPLYHPWGVNAPTPEERPENFADMEVEITAKWQAMIDAALTQA